MTRAPSRTAVDTGRLSASLVRSRSSNRLTASFEYVGKPLPADQARAVLGA